MTKYENDCCGCAVPGYPCKAPFCQFYSVPHYYCDKCHEEAELTEYNGQELCESCLPEVVKE